MDSPLDVAPIRFEASAPGKLILMGEHAAVYGRPAVVAAVGLRTRVTVSPVPGREIELLLPDLGLRERCSWNDVMKYGARRRAAWRAAHERSQDNGTEEIEAPDPAGFVKVTVAETMRAWQLGSMDRLEPGLRVSVGSELPLGSGFGSSASVAVAVAAGLLGSLSGERNLSSDDGRISAIALEAERRQHGRPSGVDHTAVIRGGLLRVSREGDDLTTSDLPRPDWLRRSLRIYDTGTPAEATGEVVAAVRKLRDRDLSGFAERLEAMTHATSEFLGALGEEEPPWQSLIGAMKTFEHCLEALEVVPSEIASVVRRIEDVGCAAKISGAGSLSGAAAGSLIVLQPPDARATAELDAILGNYRPLVAELGANGLDMESG